MCLGPYVPLHPDAAEFIEPQVVVDDVGALDEVQLPVAPEQSPKHLARKERLSAITRELASGLNLQRPLVFFDLETTGTFPLTDRIVQIGAIKLRPGGDTDLRCETVHPGGPIPPEATAVHGITDEMVAGRPSFTEIAPRVADFFADCDLAGFGVARFDVPLLEAEFGRAGITLSTEGRRIVDALRVYHERERRDLTAALDFYCGRAIEDAHSAAADAMHSLEVLAGQLRRYPDFPADLNELDRISSGADPSWIDREGKLLRRGGELVLNFSQRHKGRSLDEMAKADRGFLEWMLRADFSDHVKGLVAGALAARLPE